MPVLLHCSGPYFFTNYVLTHVYRHCKYCTVPPTTLCSHCLRNREKAILAVDHQMDDFDPYAEPKFDFEQVESPPVPRSRGTPQPEKVEPRAELQDAEPHGTLSYNGSLPIFSRDLG